jgi:hypothetical protein
MVCANVRAAAAASILIFVAGCSTSAEVPIVVATELPVMPADLAAPCRDPGVAEDAVVGIAENRQALGECSRKNARKNRFYDSVRGKFGGKR